MAVCWKVSWKLEPLPLSVPLRLLPEELPVVLDELQAVIDKATAARAAPATTAPCLRTRCISEIPSQLPAECCEEDGLDGARGFRLAEDDASRRFGGLADRREAGGQARAFHHFPASRGVWIMARGRAVEELDLGIVTSVPRSRVARGPCRAWAAVAVMLLPHTRNASTFVGCFTRDYQRRR